MSPLTFDEYQLKARETAAYPRSFAVVYPLLGLAGECGEAVQKGLDVVWPTTPTPDEWPLYVALRAFAAAAAGCEQLKKKVRDGSGYAAAGLTLPERVEQARESGWFDGMVKEILDTSWYSSALLSDIGASFGKAAEDNLAKLADRKARGVIVGSGDDR